MNADEQRQAQWRHSNLSNRSPSSLGAMLAINTPRSLRFGRASIRSITGFGCLSYSVRSACMTSTRAARAAGNAQAISAAPINTTTAANTGRKSGMRISSK